MASNSDTENSTAAGYRETATTNSDNINSSPIEIAHVLNHGNATKGPSMYKGLGKRKVEDAEDDQAHKKANTFDTKRLKVTGSARTDEETANNEQKSQTEGQRVEDVEMGGTEENDLDPELMKAANILAMKPQAEVKDDMDWAEINAHDYWHSPRTAGPRQ